MELLKEFKYYDSNTGKEIKDPDYTLAYDKNIDRFIWYDKGRKPISFVSKYKISATEGSETERKLLNRVYNDKNKPKGIDKNQIATKKWLDQKQKQAEQPQQAQQSQKPQQQPSAPTADSTEKETGKSKEKTLQNADAIVKNLSDSGTLQAEVTKALVNANDIPIFTDDFDRIGKAINKLLSKATKASVFTSEYTVDGGTPVEKGTTSAKTAKDITKEVVKKYISTTKDPSGASLHVYKILPVDGNITESNLSRYHNLREDSSPIQSADNANTGNPAQASENINKDTSEQASEQQASQPDTDVNKNEQTTESSNIVLRGSGMEDLSNKIASAVEPLVKEVTDAITSSAKAVKYHCSTLAAPNQTSEQATERKTEMNNSTILRRLLEEEEENKETATSSEDGSEKATTQEGESKDEKPSNKNTPSKTPTFPSTDTLKLIIDKLNKAGSPFETSNATYKLSYKMDNINPKDMSFDIIVTSTSTTPKDGFWKTFSANLKQYLGQAGANMLHYLGSSRGHMDI